MSQHLNARELALKLLFQVEVGRLPAEEVLEIAVEQVRPSAEDAAFARRILQGVLAEQDTLDEIIAGLAEGWRLDRLAKVDKTVLRSALYELRHPQDSAEQVVHDAVDLAKKFSTEDSGRFVHGILGSYLRRESQETAPLPEEEGTPAIGD